VFTQAMTDFFGAASATAAGASAVQATLPLIGPFETCPPILRMSVHRGRPEVAVIRSNRRE
jgi:hypothetical protein